jgi:hypothetical protein
MAQMIGDHEVEGRALDVVNLDEQPAAARDQARSERSIATGSGKCSSEWTQRDQVELPRNLLGRRGVQALESRNRLQRGLLALVEVEPEQSPAGAGGREGRQHRAAAGADVEQAAVAGNSLARASASPAPRSAPSGGR